MNAAKPRVLLLLLPAGLFLGVFFVSPVAEFLARGFSTAEGAPTLMHVDRMLAAGPYLSVLRFSVEVSAVVAIASVVIGFPVAYVLATSDKRQRSYWLLFVLLPFWSSFLVRTIAWIVILGRNGPINATLRDLGFERIDMLYTYFSIALGMTNVLVPFAILTMLGVLESIDPALMRAAGTLGARPVQAFFRVYLPLSTPGILAALLLVFVTALGFFIAPALLGGVRQTMITQSIIQQVLELTNWPFAAVLCAALLAVALAIFTLYDRLVGLSALAGEPRSQGAGSLAQATARVLGAIGDAFARIADRLPRAIPVARPAAAVAILFLLLPLLLLVPVSLSPRAFLGWPPGEPSLRWYAEIFASPLWLGAAGRSFIVAVCASLLCFAIAVPAALAFLHLGRRSAAVVFAAMVSPLIVPRLVIAVALFYVYARLGLVGTIAGLAIGHAVIALPFFFIATMAVLKTYDRRLDQAAASLGASPARTARHVTIPLIGTGLISALLFSFVVSFDELNVALFASGGLQSTLPKLMWDEATLRFSPLLAAVSTLVLTVMSAFVLLALRLSARDKE
jgi:putative spermidine/putrescine transport system permease protein